MNKQARAGLVRGIGRWDAVALTFNWIVGASIFSLPSMVYALTGTYSLFAFATCALLMVLVACCFAEVSSRFADTGGPYLYAREALGEVAGFEVGWMLWIARITASAAICNVIVSYLGYFWAPAGYGLCRAAIITALIVILTAVNIIGVRESAILSDILAIGKLIPVLLFVGAGLFFINPQSYSFATPPSPGSFSLAVSQLVFAFSGFEMAVITAGETRNPRRNMPFAVLIAIGAAVMLYILIQFVCIGTLPNLSASERPLADASNLFLGAAGASIITAGALISSTGVLGAGLLAGPRLTFAMAEQNQLPRILAVAHRRFHTPHISVLLTSSSVLALAISGTFTRNLTLSAISKLISYVATCLALFALRRRGGERPALFQLPGGPAVAAAALALCVWLLASSGWRELRDIGIAALVGLLLYLAYRLKRQEPTLKTESIQEERY
jgi:APA family basic amino acid/polyamine antiporter